MFIFENFLSNNRSINGNIEREIFELDQIATEAISNVEYGEDSTSPEMAALIVSESTSDLLRLYNATLAADLVLEGMVQEGRIREAHILLEGVMGDFFGKMKKIFSNLWAQITKFFEKVKLKLRELLDFGGKWLAKNEAKVLSNESKYPSMEFNGFKYNIEALQNSPKILDTLTKDTTDVATSSSAAVKQITSKGISSDTEFKNQLAEYDDMTVEKLLSSKLKSDISNLKGDIKDIASLKKAYRTYLRGNAENADKFKGSEGPKVKSMIYFVKNKNATLSNIEKTYADFKKVFAVIIKTLKEAESEAKKLLNDDQKSLLGRVQQVCSKAANGFKTQLNIGTQVYAVHTEELSAAARQFFSMLKKIAGEKSSSPEDGDTSGDASDDKTPTKESSLLNYLYENGAF